jgi:hypothetical protein
MLSIAARRRAMEESMSEEAQFAAIADAMDLIDSCDGALLGRVRAWRAVRNTPLYNSLGPPPGPSVGGLTGAQMEDVRRRQAAADAAWSNEIASRERWAAAQTDTAEALAAGQSPENASRIRREIRAAAGLK